MMNNIVQHKFILVCGIDFWQNMYTYDITWLYKRSSGFPTNLQIHTNMYIQYIHVYLFNKEIYRHKLN